MIFISQIRTRSGQWTKSEKMVCDMLQHLTHGLRFDLKGIERAMPDFLPLRYFPFSTASTITSNDNTAP